MPLIDLFSSRRKQAGKTADVWTYDQIPQVLRVQVSNIVADTLGPVRDYGYSSGGLYDRIVKTLAHEHGRTRLAANDQRSNVQLHGCFRSEQDLLVWLDAVELSFRVIENAMGRMGEHDRKMSHISISAKDAVTELNERFRRAGFGYRYERGEILRIDSEFMHNEATLPVLKLLSDPRSRVPMQNSAPPMLI